MTKVIAIANQKGGVGKTSTTVNLGAGLVRQGYDVLLIDLDSQANLTMALGYQNPDDMEFTISNVLHKAVQEKQIDPEEGILTTTEGIDLMPANVQLSGLEISLINEYGRENMLKQYIDEVRLNYDYILIDCAPSLSVLTVNALVAADSVLIPTQPHYFSMAGLHMCRGIEGAGPRKPVWVIDRITAHMLRHTYATMLFDAGVDVKSAQRFLGHTDIEVTLSIYTHLTKFKEEQAIQMLDKHLKEIIKEPEKRLLRVL